MFKTRGAGVKGFLNNAKTTALLVGESTLSSNNENTTPSSLELRIGTNSNVLKYRLHFSIWWMIHMKQMAMDTHYTGWQLVCCCLFYQQIFVHNFLGGGGMRGVHCTNEITHRYKIEACVLEDIKCIKLTVIWLKGCIFCDISQKNVSTFPFFLFYYFCLFYQGRIYAWLLPI